MSALAFTRATKRRSRLRLALVGPSGSGKTYTALSIATHLPPGRVALIDTEGRSASKYADVFAFDVLELDSFDPRAFTAAIHAAEAEGYTTLIIDSLSHAWMGTDGALEQVDRAKARDGNGFTAWGKVTPHQNAMIQAILQSPIHIIVTLRAKMAYVLEEDARGKQVPRKVGLQPIQRDGVEYEFDVTADLTLDHTLVVGKTRCSALDGREFPRAGKLFADVITHWLDDGAAPALPAVPPPPPPPSDKQLVHRGAKPANGPVAAPPAAAPAALTFDERTLVEALTPLFAAAKTHEDLRAVCRRAVAAGGGRNASAAYQAWFFELKAQAEAALGPVPGPGTAKAAPAAAAAHPAGKAAAS